jgi:hypothetical protein
MFVVVAIDLFQRTKQISCRKIVIRRTDFHILKLTRLNFRSTGHPSTKSSYAVSNLDSITVLTSETIVIRRRIGLAGSSNAAKGGG